MQWIQQHWTSGDRTSSWTASGNTQLQQSVMSSDHLLAGLSRGPSPSTIPGFISRLYFILQTWRKSFSFSALSTAGCRCRGAPSASFCEPGSPRLPSVQHVKLWPTCILVRWPSYLELAAEILAPSSIPFRLKHSLKTYLFE